MKELRAVLVDDEINARENLQYLLEAFCKEVTVVAEAATVETAIAQIQKYQPDVVFLDIEMPRQNGFQLLDAFESINFEVVFITAYDQHAVRAFQVAAVDYLLKPIDIDLLKKAVEKVKERRGLQKTNTGVDLLKQQKKQVDKIAIPYKSDYVIVRVEDILCIEADRMYSIIHTIDNKRYVAAKKLNYYETLFADAEFFVRVHRSWGINTNHILSYSKKERKVALYCQKHIPVSKGYKEQFEEVFMY